MEACEKPCYFDAQCHDRYTEGTVYYTGTYGEWKLVIIPVTEEIAKGKYYVVNNHHLYWCLNHCQCLKKRVTCDIFIVERSISVGGRREVPLVLR